MIDTTEYIKRLEYFLASQGWEKLNTPMEAGSEADEQHYYIRMEIRPNDYVNFDKFYWEPALAALGDAPPLGSLKQYYHADVFSVGEKHLVINVQATEYET